MMYRLEYWNQARPRISARRARCLPALDTLERQLNATLIWIRGKSEWPEAIRCLSNRAA